VLTVVVGAAATLFTAGRGVGRTALAVGSARRLTFGSARLPAGDAATVPDVRLRLCSRMCRRA